ncbi:PTS glucitol/sorbitol transporter subunit IIA [Streptococcus acidominimus]|uniref:Glucitol/sorbitol-specific phosphotransferase system (PTS), IIA component n=1 Tax=Streptococcus acidominimus TaxID=1326 RepID=A0A1Q8EF90_STRAI|nr:PTS glucitol/sorbitol transporter subunit IIA [Streptococcus acidominimus]MBF0848543.1 PTS glucitol/sorbitol transporter subunit IIA [Streptococcus danieliae]MBF0818293.1 PTS glucitol/sorbitol transporter subunit IIA [Streptococcus acidominimus]MBF0838814.1 PTS glucitol/sorbitol transporter subunit IIA [Streptococcus acidominimus]OLF50451.1 PTS sorbitol transporter subunit IIA [Streptococcus acidominimus]TFU31363.1 PTS sorbitol transporter subunit IIA [Streptococcus acidominimus]
MTKIFETKIVSIGEQAPNMIEEANMLILFGMEAPADLADYCYKISNKDLSGSILPGACLVVDGVEYPVTAVGNLVEQNLSALGHITIAFDGSQAGSLPGTLHVEAGHVPPLKEGSVISIRYEGV